MFQDGLIYLQKPCLAQKQLSSTAFDGHLRYDVSGKWVHCSNRIWGSQGIDHANQGSWARPGCRLALTLSPLLWKPVLLTMGYNFMCENHWKPRSQLLVYIVKIWFLIWIALNRHILISDESSLNSTPPRKSWWCSVHRWAPWGWDWMSINQLGTWPILVQEVVRCFFLNPMSTGNVHVPKNLGGLGKKNR